MIHQAIAPVVSSAACITCPNCSLDLPVRLSRAGEDAALWKCAGCSYPVAGVCVPAQLATKANQICLAETYFDTSDAKPITQPLREAAFALAHRTDVLPQHAARRSHRQARAIAVTAVSLNSELCPIGDPMILMMANLSKDGMGLVSPIPINERFTAIQLPPVNGLRIQVVLETIRQFALRNGHYEIGGSLVFRLGAVRVPGRVKRPAAVADQGVMTPRC